MKEKIVAAFLAAVLVLSLLCGCGNEAASKQTEQTSAVQSTAAQTESAESVRTETAEDIRARYPEARFLKLDDKSAMLDGTQLKEFDYVWRADPSMAEPQYKGDEPEEGLAAYIAHDIIYYPEIPEASFTLENYDGEQEWVTHYTAAGLEDYLFGTLPALGGTIPEQMMHSAEEAYNNPVLHITEPGDYILEGSFNGQIWIDLGEEEETFTDPSAKVRLILNGADIRCTAGPAIVFYHVYECDCEWETRETHANACDLTAAGAVVVLADGSENFVSGANVFRLLKPAYKKDSESVQKKLWKMDGAFYSYESLRIGGEEKGTGILNITGTSFEGLDSELHLEIESGYVNIFSQDDGINVNEDHVSVFVLSGGRLTVFASLGSEGDVIDSNGFIRIDGGMLAGTSKSPSDELLDSEDGTTVSPEAVLIKGGSIAGENGRPGDFGEPGMRPEDGGNPGMPGMRPEDGGNPGMPGMRPEDGGDPGMPGMKPEDGNNPGTQPVKAK